MSTHEQKWQKASGKFGSENITEEVLQASSAEYVKAIKKVANKFEKFSSDLQYRNNCIACVNAVDSHVKEKAETSGHPLQMITKEIEQSERLMNASKVIWKGSFVTKVPENSELRDSINELKHIRDDIVIAGTKPIVDWFGVSSLQEARAVKEQEEALWEQLKK